MGTATLMNYIMQVAASSSKRTVRATAVDVGFYELWWRVPANSWTTSDE